HAGEKARREVGARSPAARAIGFIDWNVTTTSSPAWDRPGVEVNAPARVVLNSHAGSGKPERRRAMWKDSRRHLFTLLIGSFVAVLFSGRAGAQIPLPRALKYVQQFANQLESEQLGQRITL